MSFKWFGPLALLAALVIGDQIRINRPAHKYRLTLDVETPEGRRSASGVFSSLSGRARTWSRCSRISTIAWFLTT